MASRTSWEVVMAPRDPRTTGWPLWKPCAKMCTVSIRKSTIPKSFGCANYQVQFLPVPINHGAATIDMYSNSMICYANFSKFLL